MSNYILNFKYVKLSKVFIMHTIIIYAILKSHSRVKFCMHKYGLYMTNLEFYIIKIL